MSEKSSSEWNQLVGAWKPIWEEWQEVMERITLAFIKTENPSNEDLELEDRLNEQLKVIRAKMDDCKSNMINRQ